MNWRNIRDEQPIEDSAIIHLDKPYEVVQYPNVKYMHYPMGMRLYSAYGQKWEDYCSWCKERNIDLPNFHWIYADEFPFPPLKTEIQ